MDAFYSQFSDFLDELIKAFPNDTDFVAYKTGLHVLHKTNPKLVPDQVVKHVSPFEETVKVRDEKFFIGHDFPEYADDDGLGSVINKMKNNWINLSEHNRNCVWDYIILLLELAKRCTSQ